MLDSIIELRSQLQLKFVEEAERLWNVIKERAIQMWREQGHWNACDKFYPVKAVARRGDGRGRETIQIPESAVVFLSAIHISREWASAQAEAAREEQAEKARNRKREQSLRWEVFYRLSAASREEAVKPIEQRTR